MRTSWSLPFFATFATFAFLLATLAPPTSNSTAVAVMAPAVGPSQSLSVAGDYTNGTSRDEFSVSEPVVVAAAPVAPAVGTPDPGTAQAIAYEMMQSMGFGEAEYACLVALWNRESGWNVYANNASSGAYGIPQALPGSKMASAGADWATNPTTQITWGLSYITGRYGTPCGAWAHSESVGWY